jgi:toluene monooxygenase electron transfer component
MNRAAVHQIRIAGGDTAFACADGDTVLRAAQRAGLGFPYECNVGSCGNCRFELIEGEVTSLWPEAPAWTDKDRERRRHLGCQSQPRSDCQVKLRLADRYAPRHRPQRAGAVLASRRAITHDLHEFRFVRDAPQAFEPGQYALAWLPGVAGARAWSMSNTAADAWEFQVRRVPGGQGSTALFDALQPGRRIELDGPYGMAWLRRDAPRDILCLAGGSGLAPMLSIARAAMVEPRLAARQLHFVYGARTPADLCGQDLLAVLPGWGERLHYHGYVSMPPPDWRGASGFVHNAASALFGARLKTMEVYFAGPPPMATAVQAMLLAAEVPPAQMHFDSFY